MGRPRKNGNPEGPKNTTFTEKEKVERKVDESKLNETQRIMNRIYIMMADPMVTMVDIIKYIQSTMEFNPKLKEVFGDVDDALIDDIKDSRIGDDAPSTKSADGMFKVLDVAKMDKATKESILEYPSYAEARGLMDIYYQTQSKRIAIQNQIREMDQGRDTELQNDSGIKNRHFMEWYLKNTITMEDSIKSALEVFSENNYLCRWARQVTGIGPVIATCLTSNLKYEEGMHAGSWWSYCGLNDNNRPWLGRTKSTEIFDELIAEYGGISDEMVQALAVRTQWSVDHFRKMAWDEKKEKWIKDKLISAAAIVPYNRDMKVLMYKIGHSFLMCKNKENSLYGRILRERMEYETAMNERGAYSEQAAECLRKKKYKTSTIAYQCYIQGKLPPAHISRRCQRYATKIFLSHLFEANYYNIHGCPAPDPYILTYGSPETGIAHSDYIPPEVPYTSVDRDPEYARINPTDPEAYNEMLKKHM